MQIFEVMHAPRRPVAEINLGAIGKAVGSAATAAAGQYVQSKTGTDTSAASGDANPYGAQKSQAAAAAKPLIDAQAKQQQKLWNTALTKTMQSMNVSDPRAMPSGTKQEMARSLMTQIHTNLLRNKLGRDYTQLPSYVDGNAQQEAQDIVKRITAAKQDILNFNAPVKDPVKSLADWQTLSQATYDAMSLAEFRPGRGPRISGAKTAQPTAQQQTAAQAAQQNLGQAAGLTPAVLNQIQSIVGKLPPTSTSDPQTRAYLDALGFRS